jgi:adenylate kinase
MSAPDAEQPRRLALLARPGAGKSTQAEHVAEHIGVAHLSSGTLLRQEAALPSAHGRTIASAIAHGDLVPDEIVVPVVITHLERAVAARGGYVLDGFPRDLAQETTFTRVVPEDVRPQVVVFLTVSAEECRRRLLARAEIEGRNDDIPGTIERRLAGFERDLVPVLRYYRHRGLLARIDGEGGPETVTKRIFERLGLS